VPKINFLIGGKQRFFEILISFKPHVADFYVFPGWLLHGAEPLRGSGGARSPSTITWTLPSADTRLDGLVFFELPSIDSFPIPSSVIRRPSSVIRRLSSAI
jgi:hypothetical protein